MSTATDEGRRGAVAGFEGSVPGEEQRLRGFEPLPQVVGEGDEDAETDIESLYEKRFGRPRPQVVRPIEASAADQAERQAKRRSERQRRRETG